MTKKAIWNPYNFLFVLALLSLGVSAAFFIYVAIRAIVYPYPLDYGEGQVIDQAIRLAQGQDIYRVDLTNPPYLVTNYPPVFMLLIAPFMRLFGSNFWAGRLISTMSTVLSAAFLSLIIWRLSRNWLAAVIAGSEFLALPIVVYWAPLNRIDMVGLMFSLAGLWLFLQWQDQLWSLLLGSFFFIAAVYTKQTYGLAAPCTILLFLILKKNYRRAAAFLTLYGGIGILTLLIMNYLTDGGFFFSLITTNQSPWQIEKLWPIQLSISLVILIVFVLLRRPWFKVWRPVGFYWIGGALVGVTIGKVGANVNYLLEWFAGFCMLVGIFVVLAGNRTAKLGLVLPAITISTISLIPLSSQLALNLIVERSQPAFIADMEEMRYLIRQVEGPILVDEFDGLLILEGRQLYFQPFDMTQLARKGLWDQKPFLDEIGAYTFPLILISNIRPNIVQERWTDEMLLTIESHYRILKWIGFTAVYVPDR